MPAHKAGHVARIERTDAVAQIIIAVEERIIAHHARPAFGGYRIVQTGKMALGETAAAFTVARDHDPTSPVGGRIGKNLGGETRVTSRDIAHETVGAIPERAHDRREAVVVIRAGQRGGQHHQKRPDHGEPTQRQNGIDQSQEDPGLGCLALDCQNHRHVRCAYRSTLHRGVPISKLLNAETPRFLGMAA